MDLDAVFKFLDTAGNKLDYRRYGEVLLEILIAGGLLAPGGSYQNEVCKHFLSFIFGYYFFQKGRRQTGHDQGLRLPGCLRHRPGQGLGPAGLRQAHAEVQVPREDAGRRDEKDSGVSQGIHRCKYNIFDIFLYS